MKIGSLFSGIGGLELGLERSGLGHVVWQAEIDPFCRAVLRKHWPDAKIFDDVRHVDSNASPVEIICGGFPCQDLSTANSSGRDGLMGTKSGLWSEFIRIVSIILPKWVIVENVAKTWRDWVPTIRDDLSRIGYGSISYKISSDSLGAKHARHRVFVVANSNRNCKSFLQINEKMAELQKDARRFRGYWRNAFAGPVRLADGFSGRLGEVRAYGNAVVPVCAEVVGTAIRMCEGEK